MARYYEKASQVAATCRRVHFFLGFSSAGWCIQWIPHPSFSSGISSLFSWHWAASVVLYCQLFWPRISLLAVLDDYCGRRTGWPLDIHKIKCATWGGEHHVTVRTRHSRVFSQQVHPVGLTAVTNLRVDYSSIKGHRCASYPFSSFRRGVTVSAGSARCCRCCDKSFTPRGEVEDFSFSSRSHTLIDAQLPFSITRLFCLERQIIRNDMDFKFNLLKC